MRSQVVTMKGLITVNNSTSGTPLEYNLRKMLEDGTPIKATSPIFYTEKKAGVLPQTNIRTNKWDVAEATMERVSLAQIARRNQDKEKSPKIGDEKATSGKTEQTP